MLSLQEKIFIKLSVKQKEELPLYIQEKMIHSLSTRICRAFKRGRFYKRKFLMRIQKEQEITKSAYVYLISAYCISHRTTIKTFITYLHNFFHDQENNIEFPAEKMDEILILFRQTVPNDAHSFFRYLLAICIDSENLYMQEHDIKKILNVFSIEVLKKMWGKLC